MYYYYKIFDYNNYKENEKMSGNKNNEYINFVKHNI
jgi:hypothetical protein